MKQVQGIMDWSEPTARAFVRLWGEMKKSPNRPYAKRWEVDSELLLLQIKGEEKDIMDKKSRYYAEARKQEQNA